MTAFFKLIRPVNLALLAFVQILLKYALFPSLAAVTSLSDIQFILLAAATLCIAAGGNIINDIYDVDIDRINKPQSLLIGKSITEKAAMRYYILLNVTGVGIGFYLSNSIGRPGFAALFIVISALLYLYASYLKGILLIGNLLVATLVAGSLIMVGLFDLFPAVTPQNQAGQSDVFRVLLHYAGFAFLLTFIREVVKDLQDVNGDKNGGLNTLPIAIGRSRATFIAFSLGAITIALVVGYMYVFLYESEWAVLYFLGLVVAPLLYFCVKAYNAETRKQYAFLSFLLKGIMLTGMGSMLLYYWAVGLH